jgi:hypothetical protein
LSRIVEVDNALAATITVVIVAFAVVLAFSNPKGVVAWNERQKVRTFQGVALKFQISNERPGRGEF